MAGTSPAMTATMESPIAVSRCNDIGTSALLLAALLARGVARIALGLLLNLERSLACGFLFLFPRNPCGLRGGRFRLAPLLLDLLGLAREPRLLATSRDRLALGAALQDFGIVGPRLGAEFV